MFLCFGFSHICLATESLAQIQPIQSAQDSQTKIESLIKQSKALKLAQSKEWKTLLHIRHKKSEIVSPYFFLSDTRTAQDELEATIKAIYQSPQDVQVPQVIIDKREELIKLYQENNIKLPTRSISALDYHALCRFPARVAFLKKHLTLENLPSLPCEEYHEMLNYIAPTKATIVFPAAHINSPASMFGHTFLLLDSTFNSRLLAFAINYQADADQEHENALIFALKGLFGLYSGSYSILPYYDKIKEYNDAENRDMWEYELNLTQEEVLKMYRHIWELSDAFSWYYFFHRNCSYNVLWLLEVARDNLRLRDEFIYQVNPPETLFALQKAKLIANVVYRPSKRSILLAYEDKMSLKDTSLAKALAKGKHSPDEILLNSSLSLLQKQYILESGIELSEYYAMKNKIDRESYTQIAHDLATKRATLGKSEAPTIYTPTNPLEGNQSLRVTPLMLANSQGFHPALDFRITYHDITDNDRGYLKGAQIEFLRTLAYYDTSAHKNPSWDSFRIYEMHILSVASYGMMSKFFKPLSYRIDTGFNRNFLGDHLSYYLALGGGVAYEFNHYLYGFYLLEPTFFLDGTRAYQADFALSNVVGIVLQNNKRLKFTIEYKLKAYDLRTFGHYADASVSINLYQNLALLGRAELKTLDAYHAPRLDNTYMLGLRIYF
ncbi:DUF4105 domain-containing protein [Helicobacter sp. MIT 05-5293]|uniref:Lnb N-terminal periplasmic domain-containing protein n=1 Tax=Helicobacter sp. MIT 05-5293 TaxID=1548149 RepID=UPI00068BE450|nr:DUF4105 domain-containing protein [Helicobacter sp. MIT 05-5293]TLD80445.1 DUF4105 domain-containing protein [Helicobacter sp. MIT 05-5293]